MILKGNKEFSEIFKGNKEITNIYKGNKEIYGGSKVYYLGYGNSFNARNVVPKWQDLTLNNFFFIRQGSLASSSSGAYDDPGVYYSSMNYANSLSNGVYTHYATAGTPRGSSSNSNYVVVCTKPEKLIYLGSGSVDLKTLYPDKWEEFTIDNFLIKNVKGAGGGVRTSGDEDDNFTAQAQVQVSYSNGVISAQYYDYCNTRGPGHDRDSNATANMPIYLHKGKIIGLD